MDLNQRKQTLDEHLGAFFETREDALWLFDRIRQLIKDHYPDEQLTQRERREHSETREHTTNQVEGNIWARMRVCAYYSNADFDRRLPGNWATRQMLSWPKSTTLPLKLLVSPEFNVRSTSFVF